MSEDGQQENAASAATLRQGKRLGVFTGNYLFVLGCLGLAGTVVGLFLRRGFQLDLTFLVFLLLGRVLWELRNGARVTALVISGVYIVAGLTAVAYALIKGTEGMTVTVFGKEYSSPGLVLFLGVALGLLLVFAVPFGVLLHPAARRVFRATTQLRKMRLARLRKLEQD